MLEYARALDIEADYLTELVEAASGHMAWAIADMSRKNFDSVLSRSSDGPRSATSGSCPTTAPTPIPRSWRATRRWASCRTTPSARRYGTSTRENGYTFPGDPTALNAAFATPHDSTHVISGYDTSARGEILVSTFTAGMHPINPMAGTSCR